MKPTLNRRDFLQMASASAAACGLPGHLLAQTPAAKVTFSFGHTAVSTMPLDFTGLSYESPQLANPAFFSAANKELVSIFRELGPTGGILRTGGNLSAFTGWRDDPSIPLTPSEQTAFDKGRHYWEWDLTDPTIRHGNHIAVFTPASIKTLAGFLDATGWKLLYGLNFGTGTPEQAAAEAACVQRLCGKNLVAFQLGNEIDFWNGGLRPKGWDFDTYFAQWKVWVKVIRATTPNAAFAGPDTAVNLDWMEKMADRMGNGIALLTKHHYAMGPAGDPKMDARHLLGPDPEVAKEIASAQRAKAFAGVGFRTSECGSCFHGGQPGVSNAFASALWGADYMLALAQGGHAGINMHGGGDGFYSPITGDADRGFVRQPLYFGMRFAQMFSGATLLDGTVSAGSTNLTAYAAHRQHDTLIALINKDSVPVDVDIARNSITKLALAETWQLTAPSIDSRTGVTLQKSPTPQSASTGKRGETFHLPAYSALYLRYS